MDAFLDRVAATSGHTSRALLQVAKELEEYEDLTGLKFTQFVVVLRRIARDHQEIVCDCYEGTPVRPVNADNPRALPGRKPTDRGLPQAG